MFKIILSGKKGFRSSLPTILFAGAVYFMLLSLIGDTAYGSGYSKGAMVDKDLTERERKTLDLLSKIDAFSEEDERLRNDAAKAHYNMGNIYFHKGEHRIAAREYYQAVALLPDDPDAHFNLAYVSDEYLQDWKTARKHYQMYLYLKPQAKDGAFVKERLIAVNLKLKSFVDSPLGND